MSKAINIFLSLKPAFKIRTALNTLIYATNLFNFSIMSKKTFDFLK